LRLFRLGGALGSAARFFGALAGEASGALVRSARAFRSRIGTPEWGFSSCIFADVPESSRNKFRWSAW
jgi:hypothetical protein